MTFIYILSISLLVVNLLLLILVFVQFQALRRSFDDFIDGDFTIYVGKDKPGKIDFYRK